MRISSSCPLNHSDHTLLPPKRSAPALFGSVPPTGWELTWAPLMNRRWVVPSQVIARCAQALRDSGAVPLVKRSPVV
jgi:hypothetical protein